MTENEKNARALFPETADIETASDAYAARFAGATGQWMLAVQERITLDMIGRGNRNDILDVGGGHGQLAVPLCRAGYQATVLGSSQSCGKRISEIVASGKCEFRVGNVIDMPFPERSFHTVICFRLLTHCGAWSKLIAELCRVAAERVVVDYPTSRSLNKIAPVLFSAKKRFEGNTREWTLFRHEQILSEFARNGFIQDKRRPEFFLPMVFHRMIKCRPLSAAIEAVCRAAGLTAAWGSPVILRAIRKS